jgi:hypothetical protein
MDTKGLHLGDSFSLGALYPGRALAFVGAVLLVAAFVHAF